MVLFVCLFSYLKIELNATHKTFIIIILYSSSYFSFIIIFDLAFKTEE